MSLAVSPSSVSLSLNKPSGKVSSRLSWTSWPVGESKMRHSAVKTGRRLTRLKRPLRGRQRHHMSATFSALFGTIRGLAGAPLLLTLLFLSGFMAPAGGGPSLTVYLQGCERASLLLCFCKLSAVWGIEPVTFSLLPALRTTDFSFQLRFPGARHRTVS